MNAFRALVAVVVLSLTPFRALAASAERPRYQAVWVDAFHEGFKSPDQTRKLIEWARRNNVNALFVEMRKAGDAYYPSKVEPVASDISPANYDPLADLIAQAHDTRDGKQRIELHAWIIVYRVSTGGSVAADHVMRKHPGWLGQTYGGATKDEEKNSHLDPGVPDVITHTDRIVADLVQRYEIDGIHFDRIRYPGKQWGYNPTAVARFRSVTGGLTGRLFRPRPDDAAWGDFRRQQVSMMLRRLFITAKAYRPAVKVSAATIAFDECASDFKKSRSYYDVFQDWQTWVRADLLDLNIPMIYKRDHLAAQSRDYRQWLDFLTTNRGTALPIVGQGSFINSAAGTLRQVSLAQQHPELAGVCLFSYAAPVEKGERADFLMEGLRKNYFRPNVPVPALTPPEKTGVGWVAGVVTGDKIDYVEVTLGTRPVRPTHTDGSGFFAFMRVPVGEYEVTANLARSRNLTQKVRVTAGKVAVVKLAP